MRAKPFLTGFLGVMVVIVAVSAYLAATIERPDKSVAVVASPNGKYKAVRLTVSGDTPVPFCVDTISIFLSVYPDSFAASESSYEVYGAPCAAPEKRAALPKMEWLSNEALRITYPAGMGGAGKKPRLKELDESRFVHLTFVAQE